MKTESYTYITLLSSSNILDNIHHRRHTALSLSGLPCFFSYLIKEALKCWGACLVYILYEIFDEWLNYYSLHVLNDTLEAPQGGAFRWAIQRKQRYTKLRDGSKGVHEPLMLFEVLISRLRAKVNMKQN